MRWWVTLILHNIESRFLNNTSFNQPSHVISRPFLASSIGRLKVRSVRFSIELATQPPTLLTGALKFSLIRDGGKQAASRSNKFLASPSPICWRSCLRLLKTRSIEHNYQASLSWPGFYQGVMYLELDWGKHKQLGHRRKRAIIMRTSIYFLVILKGPVLIKLPFFLFTFVITIILEMLRYFGL